MASPRRTAGTQTLASPPYILIRPALVLGTGVTCTVEEGLDQSPRTSSQRSLQWFLSLSEPRFPFLYNAVPWAPAFCDPPISKQGSRGLCSASDRNVTRALCEQKENAWREKNGVMFLLCLFPFRCPLQPAVLGSDLLLLTASSSSAAPWRNGTVPEAARSGPVSVSYKHCSALARQHPELLRK